MFGVYIHWPFCAQKCPYCDFNSHVRFGGWDEARFLAAYKRELDDVAESIASSPLPLWGRPGGGRSPTAGGLGTPTPEGGWGCASRTVTSIFFGGGTPSLMKPETVGGILDHIGKLWIVDPGAEITIEANPGSVEAARFKGYRAAGVNRVSMGFQSFNDDELKKLGRIHTVEEAKAALNIARQTFDRYSFDLIYARPGQTPAAWRAELAEALALAGDHLSLYQLTIEPDTPYAALAAAGKLVIPGDDTARNLYEITQEMTEVCGLPAYEISNHAAPGEESRHNLTYWRYGEYAGVGPGAHGRLLASRGDFPAGSQPPHAVRVATVAEKNPEKWCELVEKQGHGFIEQTELTPPEEADEMLLMGLRLREGVDLRRLAALGGVAPSSDTVADLRALGLIETDWTDRVPSTDKATVRTTTGNWRSNELEAIPMCTGPGLPPEQQAVTRIRSTPEGRFVLNAVVAKLAGSFMPVDPGSAVLPVHITHGHMDRRRDTQ